MDEHPDGRQILNNFAQALDRIQVAEIEPRKAERDRLVWYVGIAGYVLVNSQGAWKVLSGRDITASDLLWLSAPWVAAALFSLLAHFLTDEWIDRDNLHYHALRVEVDRLSSLGAQRPIESTEWMELIAGSKPRFAELQRKTKRYRGWARAYRIAASASLFIAFLWSVVGPVVLRRAAIPVATAALTVDVRGERLHLPASHWKAMTNPETYTDNFEAREKGDGEAFPQVVTIFKLPMSERNRGGERVGDSEYAEFVLVHPGKVTLHLRVDRGRYWVMSRQTFEAAAPPGLPKYSPVLSEEENRLLAEVFEVEVTRTRWALQEVFPPAVR